MQINNPYLKGVVIMKHFMILNSLLCSDSNQYKDLIGFRLTCWLVVVVQERVFPLAALQTGAGTHSVGNKSLRFEC